MNYKNQLIEEGFSETESEKIEEDIKTNEKRFLRIYNNKETFEKHIGFIYLIMTKKLKKFGIENISYYEYKNGDLYLIEDIIQTLGELNEKNIIERIESCNNKLELKKLYLNSLFLIAEKKKIQNKKIKICEKFLIFFNKLKKEFKNIKILDNYCQIYSALRFQEIGSYEEWIKDIEKNKNFFVEFTENERIINVCFFEDLEGKINIEEIFYYENTIMLDFEKKFEKIVNNLN